MAKKLNKKVVIIGLSVLALGAIGVGILGIRYMRNRNPELNLRLAQEALAENDYERARRHMGRAYAHGPTDAYKIERLFDLAELHLIDDEHQQANWPRALRSWNTVLNIDPRNKQARRKMLEYFYEMADSGAAAAWQNVHENATELLDIYADGDSKPDSELLAAYGRAALSIARRGGTTNPEDYVTQAIDTFEALIEREPGVHSHYAYLADAMLVQGSLRATAGIMRADERAQQTAMRRLDEAIEQSENKSAAIAARYRHELRASADDPNAIERMRADIEEYLQTLPPDPELLTVLSQTHELFGRRDAESSLNRAIETARQAHRLAPEEFQYAYRLASLLYRRGSAFNDTAAMDDALELANEMLTMRQTQPLAGPRERRSLVNRNAVDVFLARCYLEHALDRPDDAHTWIQRAEPHVERISQFYGSSEHIAVQQWQGMLALAKGQRDRGIRLLYRAYEQARAYDSPNQPSTVDPVLCMVLARVAREENLIGRQREFLERAMFNRSRIISDRPDLILEYAELMAKHQGWRNALVSAQSYQQRYGVNERSRQIITDAALALGETEYVTEAIAALPEGSDQRNALELRFVSSQITQKARRLARLELEAQDEQAIAALRDDINNLRPHQQQLLSDLLAHAPEKVELSVLNSVILHYAQNDKIQDAAELLDAYLAHDPDAFSVQVLRRQLDAPDPLSAISHEQYRAFQLDAAGHLDDAKKRAMTKAELYRGWGEYDTALEMLQQAAQAAPDDDDDVIRMQFDIALDREDIETAQRLQQVIRTRNLDDFEGNMAAAQLEHLKGNYSLALRRVDECLAINPLISSGYYVKSLIYRDMDDLDAAIENSSQAAQADPLNSLYARNHASLLFDRNAALGTRVTSSQQEELIQAITMAIALNPNQWQLQSVFAEVISETEPDRAIAIRRQLLGQHPTVTNAVMLGNMALRMARAERDTAKRSGLIELSGQAYNQALEIDPGSETAKAAYAEFLNLTRQSEQAEALLRDDENLLWRFYLQSGRYDDAKEVLTELHQSNPQDINILRGLVLTAEGAGNRTEFKYHLDRLAELDHDKDGRLWLIQKYLDGGYADDANRKLTRLTDRYPDEQLVLLLEAWIKMTHGQLDEAMTLTNRYLESDMHNAGAWRLRGRIRRLMNEPRQALDDLQRSKSLSADPTVSMELAMVYRELRQIDAAIGELRSGLQEAQPPVQMRHLLESIYQENNRTADLERFYNQTIEQFPNDPAWPMRAGRYYLSIDQPDRAMPYLNRAWTIYREHGRVNPAILNLVLDAMIANQMVDTALEVASTVIDGPLAPLAYAHRATAHFKQGRTGDAETSFLTALDRAGTHDEFQAKILSLILETVGQDLAVRWIERDPDRLANRLLSYHLAAHNEQYNRGLNIIRQCMAEVAPDQPEWANLSLKKASLLVRAYMKTADGQYLSRSIDVFEDILERYPENPSILNNMAYLLATNDQQLDTAMHYARRAHQHDPDNPVYLDTYAYTQYKNGNLEAAQRNLLRALHLFEVSQRTVPWNVYDHLGQVYESLGQASLAIDNFHNALNAASDIPEPEQQRLKERISALEQHANMTL